MSKPLNTRLVHATCIVFLVQTALSILVMVAAMIMFTVSAAAMADYEADYDAELAELCTVNPAAPECAW